MGPFNSSCPQGIQVAQLAWTYIHQVGYDPFSLEFPWRFERTPYTVLVSEILLKKTTASQVRSVFLDFIKKFPEPCILARSSEEELWHILRPLGL
ncbi:MAG: hypothetical protein ACP5JV_11480, partial [Thermus sp.]